MKYRTLDPLTDFHAGRKTKLPTGMIPGKVTPKGGDDTQIPAQQGEYIFSVDAVMGAGKRALDQIQTGLKQEMGNNIPPRNAEGSISELPPGMAEGGGVIDRLKSFIGVGPNPRPPLVDLSSMVRTSQPAKPENGSKPIGIQKLNPFNPVIKALDAAKLRAGYEQGGGITDYDMPGYIAKYGQPDQSKGQHLTDEFKLPNHITFSTDSKYNTPEQQGGQWKQESGKWHFYASPFNLQNTPADKMQEYFRIREPDSVLHLPNSQGGYAEGGGITDYDPNKKKVDEGQLALEGLVSASQVGPRPDPNQGIASMPVIPNVPSSQIVNSDTPQDTTEGKVIDGRTYFPSAFGDLRDNFNMTPELNAENKARPFMQSVSDTPGGSRTVQIVQPDIATGVMPAVTMPNGGYIPPGLPPADFGRRASEENALFSQAENIKTPWHQQNGKASSSGENITTVPATQAIAKEINERNRRENELTKYAAIEREKMAETERKAQRDEAAIAKDKALARKAGAAGTKLNNAQTLRLKEIEKELYPPAKDALRAQITGAGGLTPDRKQELEDERNEIMKAGGVIVPTKKAKKQSTSTGSKPSLESFWK